MTWEWHGMDHTRTASVENEKLQYTCNYFKLAFQVMYINGLEYLPIVLILTHKIQRVTTFRSCLLAISDCFTYFNYNRHFA